MLKNHGLIQFPKKSLQPINVNMMPIVMGQENTVPEYLQQYLPIINKCNLQQGTTIYLTIHEDFVLKGNTLRRYGWHTDGTAQHEWGGGSWGGKGIYMASSDGMCEVSRIEMNAGIDKLGSVNSNFLDLVRNNAFELKPNYLYQISDRQPHCSIPAKEDGWRQFFRLVSNQVSIWYSKHSTPNPYDIKPDCHISDINKFE